MDNNEKYLILGASRGGTTILAAALGSHPAVAILDEELTGAFSRITGGKIPGVKLCIPNQVELDRRWSPLYKPGLMSGFLRKSMFMSRIPKSPLSIRDYDQLGRIRHICIMRHPAGVISSIVNRENRAQQVAVYRWQRCIEVFAALDQDPSYDPIFVSFETLVTEPEKTLRALCDALELEFSEHMMGAPNRNARYRSHGFDSAKAQYDNAEDIWQLFPPDLQARYLALVKQAL